VTALSLFAAGTATTIKVADRFILYRPDTVRPKPMGYAIRTASDLLIVLEQLRTQRPNESFRGMSQGAMMGIRAKNKATGERTRAAIEQSGIITRGRPSKVTLTRVTTGKMDDDGLVGAMKFVRDGIAKALGFDDREMSIGGMVAGKIPIFYDQRAPGKRGVYAVEILIEWAT
jgi:hypothetical protein